MHSSYTNIFSYQPTKKLPSSHSPQKMKERKSKHKHISKVLYSSCLFVCFLVFLSMLCLFTIHYSLVLDSFFVWYVQKCTACVYYIFMLSFDDHNLFFPLDFLDHHLHPNHQSINKDLLNDHKVHG